MSEEKSSFPESRFRDTTEVIGAILKAAAGGWILKTHLLRAVQFGNQPGGWYLDALEAAGLIEFRTRERGQTETYIRTTPAGLEMMEKISGLVADLDPVLWDIWRRRGGARKKM